MKHRLTVVLVLSLLVLLSTLLWSQEPVRKVQYTTGNEYGMLATMQLANQQGNPETTGQNVPPGLTPEAGCTTGGDVLCLNQNRFRITANWRNYNDNSTGTGKAVLLTCDSGYFWFFNQANIELVIKVLDGSSINGYFWVFYGALSDVEYTILIADTCTGQTKTYSNPPHQLASVADVRAIPFSPGCGTSCGGGGGGGSRCSGLWSGSIMNFNVSSDGTKITATGSPLSYAGRGVSLRLGPVYVSGSCASGTATYYHYVDIPITGDGFSYSGSEVSFDGRFSGRSASGNYSAAINATYCTVRGSGSWQATCSQGAAAELFNLDMVPGTSGSYAIQTPEGTIVINRKNE